MPNPHEIASDIEAFLDSPQARSREDLARLATTYSALCESTNVRLRRCADYLQHGLRSEAIYHAEVEPDLLDTVGALDLRRIERWDAVCGKNQLDRAPRLLLEVAREINEAYTTEQPMRDQLKRLRVLCLIRAPLGARLRALRSLAKLDPNNPIWEEDIQSLEAERLKEIAAEAKQAAKREDREALEGLLREANSWRWRIKVPQNLIDAVHGLLNGVQNSQALEELNALLPELSDAYSAASYEECSTLLKQWERIASPDAVNVPTGMQAQIQPILDWVASQEHEREMQRQFSAACARLEQALDNNASDAELRKLYSQATSFEQPIQEELDRRLRQELENRALARRRRNRVRLAVIIPVVVAAGIVVAVFVRQGVLNRRTEQYHAQFATLMEEGKLEEARRFWTWLEQEEPDLASRDQLAADKTQLALAIVAESERQEQFRSAMARAKEAGVKTPDLASLRIAKKVARTSGEKLEVLNLEGQIAEEAQKQQRLRDEAFGGEARKTSEAMSALKKDLLERDPEAFGRELARLEGGIRRLREIPKVSRDVMEAAVYPLEKRLASWRKTLREVKRIEQERSQEQKKLAGLAGYARSAADLAKALDSFVAAHPVSTKAGAFKRAAKCLPDWLAVQEWIGLVSSWKGNLVPKKGADITARLEAIDNYVEKHPSSPFNNDSLKHYVEYLSQAQRALSEDSPWRKDLPALMNVPIIRDLYLFVRDGDGKTYYMPRGGKYSKSAVGVTCEVILTQDTSKSVKKLIRARPVTEPQPSPHIVLAQKVIKKLADLSSSNWDIFGLEASDMIRREDDVDAVLRAMLLEEALKQLRQVGWGIEEEVDAMLRVLSGLDMDNILWMDPDDRAANRSRSQIEASIKQFKPFEDLIEHVRTKRTELKKSVLLSCVGYGVVMRDDEGWQVQTVSELHKDGLRAMVVGEAPGASTKTLRKIGEAKDGQFVLDESSMAGVPEGSMVFILE